ncbi:probable ATP-dependent RNA helicase DHX37 [Galendromus occidentalis]|uniref:RNA helicase n=1 Tax=Galendromus occidentalis TaxID=34638 RepID=A0AAJ7WGY2_9ACAR|nr:probable ATP-dependent RNA helicase DHX37 [Galendromus occidentalis]
MGRVKKLRKLLRHQEVREGLLKGEPDGAEEPSPESTEVQDGQKKKASKAALAANFKEKKTAHLSKKKKKELLKVLEKKQKRRNREAIVEKLSQLKQEATRDRRKLCPQKSSKSLRKRRVSAVQKWGKGASEPKQPRPDVLGFEEGSDGDDETTDEELSGASEGDEEPEITEQKEETVTAPEIPRGDTIPFKKHSTINDEDDDIGEINANIGHLNPMKSIQPVLLNRPPEVIKHRSELPIINMEQEITETIATNPVTIICGQTGSGKTTQVVQFLYEAGYGHSGLIGITEPRRIAAISTSKRVAYETGLGQEIVSYQVRFEGNCSEKTRIKFCTDGVLLKEMEHDLSLSKYSVVIIDEAHERSVHSDIVIGLLSRVVKLRESKGKPLRVIIMSATLRVTDFTENEKLFKIPPPVIDVESRQYPVTIHFNRTTPKDYMQDAFKKICKIHNKLPPGGILVFVTGKMEVIRLVNQLKSRFPPPNDEAYPKRERSKARAARGNSPAVVETDGPEVPQGAEKSSDVDKAGGDDQETIDDPAANRDSKQGLDLEKYDLYPIEEADLGDQMDNEDSSDEEEKALTENDDESSDSGGEAFPQVDCNASSAMKVLPMYAMLPSSLQQRVFEEMNDQSRLCVIATNVAETSLTIPGIRYVIDCGKCKTRVYDKVTGISKFLVTWTSKAAATQRAGRAGRQGPGHCYRLYSSAVFNDSFVEHTPAEITLRPVDGLMLQMKCMGIEKVINFPFPTPPAKEALVAAENCLVEIGALERTQMKPLSVRERENWLYSSTATPLGRAMGCFPVAPRYAKMLALSYQDSSLLPYVITLIAGLAIQEPFVKGKGTCPASCKGLGDMGRLLAAVGASEFSQQSLCQLRSAALQEIRKMRRQLTEELNLLVPDLELALDPKMTPPSHAQMNALRQIILCAMADRVARKKHGKVYECMQTEDVVSIHGDSVLFNDQPPWVVFQEITEDTNNKMKLRMLCPIEEHWLPTLAPKHCVLSEPLDSPPPEYNAAKDCLLVWQNGTYGPLAWELSKSQQKVPTHWKERFNWFAKALLEGQVIKYFKMFAKHYVSPPAIIVKRYSALSQRSSDLVAALRQADICSKKDLSTKWENDPQFLLKIVLDWLPSEVHGKVKMSWPPKTT